MNLFDRIFNLDELTSSQNDKTHKLQLHEDHSSSPSNVIKLLIQLKNCRLYRDAQLISEDLWIRDGVIQDPKSIFFDEKTQADLQIDCENLIISPGFIDVQINGAFGKDFTNDLNTDECLNTVSNGLLQYGVTSYCPTLISSEPDAYHRILPAIKSHIESAKASKHLTSRILGVHLEGPFINKDKPGAHDKSALRLFENGLSTLEHVYGQDVNNLKDIVSIVTLAPELDPKSEIVKALSSTDIIVSLGHSSANLEQGEQAVKHGAKFITHLFNAMLPFHHRDPHLIGLLSNRSIYYGIIADGIHTHPSAIFIAYRAHPEGLVLVTDAMSAMGLEDGRVHHIGSQCVEIVRDPDNKKLRSAYVQGTRTLCGSVATMDDCVQNLIKATGCSLEEALKCATENPARLLGVYPLEGGLYSTGLRQTLLLWMRGLM